MTRFNGSGVGACEVYDVTGAGDNTIIARRSRRPAFSTNANVVKAAVLADHVARIVVGKVGTVAASADKLVRSFEEK